MFKFFLPKNSVPKEGVVYDTNSSSNDLKVFIYRYEPGSESPSIDTFTLDKSRCGNMILDLLINIKDKIDPNLTFRRSCREGVCGSCAMSIGKKSSKCSNKLACTTSISDFDNEIHIYPLPHMAVIKDLVVDMTSFYDQYKKVKPWLVNDTKTDDNRERLQSISDYKKLQGLYECILCACCTTGCPSYWWNSDKFVGPAALLQSYRFLRDSRDKAKSERMSQLKSNLGVYKCHAILNCTQACPKGLDPASVIRDIKVKVLLESMRLSKKNHCDNEELLSK